MASSRFGSSSLHQRDARSTLFDSYDRNRPSSHSPAGRQGYSYNAGGGSNSYPGSSSNGGLNANGNAPGGGGGGFRPATPNSRGQYSDAVLSELENQNEAQLEGMSAKVKMLKDITSAIGVEIRDSSKLAETMNEGFDTTRLRLKGTMNRMLRMAEKTGVGWKVWVLFFLAVWGVFAWVWLF
ncbi:MAG: protein transport protein bet1 [Heterodermia speciosa]|uniref:Protein transport protein bet1 n=1 Tax=Heterodermia speciosa TaxID=116794 RepID=A0A8H3G5R8_9LECA|nr:MAG: protein transport protein bet1 [Heterodermia speciosa]